MTTHQLDPVYERKLTDIAVERRGRHEIRKRLQPLFERIQRLHSVRKLDPDKHRYDAWSCPPSSRRFQMRGVRNCPRCEGMGYEWFQLFGDGAWIRCVSCVSLLKMKRETKSANNNLIRR